jgi:hypothetical protein
MKKKAPVRDILSRDKELQKPKYRHEILVRGKDLESCKSKVLRFFRDYQLVRYSSVIILEAESVPSSDPDFTARLQTAQIENRRLLHKLVEELRGEGINLLNDLENMPQGYRTKMLHVITHLLDGFFGIDSYFYNLEEDSHWVSDEMKRKIERSPVDYWLLPLEGRI